MYYKHPEPNSLENISFSIEEMMSFLRSHGYDFKQKVHKVYQNVYHNDVEESNSDIIHVIKDGVDLTENLLISHHTQKDEFVRKVFFKEFKSSLLSFFSGDR